MYGQDFSALPGAMAVGGVFLAFLGLGFLVIMLVAWAQIFKKMGHSGALALLFVIPLVNIIMFFWVAFSDWPVLRELRDLRRSGHTPWPGNRPPQGY